MHRALRNLFTAERPRHEFPALDTRQVVYRAVKFPARSVGTIGVDRPYLMEVNSAESVHDLCCYGRGLRFTFPNRQRFCRRRWYTGKFLRPASQIEQDLKPLFVPLFP